jgi:hypothetical protein
MTWKILKDSAKCAVLAAYSAKSAVLAAYSACRPTCLLSLLQGALLHVFEDHASLTSQLLDLDLRG